MQLEHTPDVSAEQSEKERREEFFNNVQSTLLAEPFAMPQRNAYDSTTDEGRRAYVQAVSDWMQRSDDFAKKVGDVFDAHGRLGVAEDDWTLLSVEEARAKTVAALKQAETVH